MNFLKDYLGLYMETILVDAIIASSFPTLDKLLQRLALNCVLWCLYLYTYNVLLTVPNNMPQREASYVDVSLVALAKSRQCFHQCLPLIRSLPPNQA